MLLFLWSVFAALAPALCRAAQSCPAQVTVPNGDFEGGSLTPWYVPAPQAGDPTTTIVSPGYLSKHALQLGVAASNFTDFSYINPSVGQQCQGYYYRVTFATNWGTYSGPPSTDNIGCKVIMQSSYCFREIVGAQQIYAAPGGGWKFHTFTCMAQKTGQASYTVDFSCFGNATYKVPAFKFELDALNITILKAPPS